MITTFTMSVKMDFADPQKYDVMKEMMRQFGRDLFATAMLLKDKREPSIILSYNDPEVGNQTINMMDEATS